MTLPTPTQLEDLIRTLDKDAREVRDKYTCSQVSAALEKTGGAVATGVNLFGGTAASSAVNAGAAAANIQSGLVAASAHGRDDAASGRHDARRRRLGGT
jgi:hypothetical protein